MHDPDSVLNEAGKRDRLSCADFGAAPLQVSIAGWQDDRDRAAISCSAQEDYL